MLTRDRSGLFTEEVDAPKPPKDAASAGNGKDHDEALVTELAGLRDLTYQHRRQAASDELGIGVGALDKIVARRRAELEDNNPVPLAEHWTVNPWPEPVDIDVL